MICTKQIPDYVKRLPYVGSALCVIGFFVCFIITKSLKHIPDWLVTPPISFLGFDNPEHYVYAFCFSAGAICYQIAFCYIQRYSFLSCGIQCDGFSGKWLRVAAIIAMCSPIFLIIQAIIPLQKDLLDENVKVTTASIIHQSSAIVLFLLTLLHATIVCHFVRHVEGHYYKPASVLLKNIGLVVMIISLIGSVVFHPASNLTGMQSHFIFNAAGIFQWIFVIAMLMFYSSYGIDFATYPQGLLNHEEAEEESK